MQIITKGLYDRRTMYEVVSSLLTERLEEGDSLYIKVVYNGVEKPRLTLEFATREKSNKEDVIDLTDWLPPTPSVKRLDGEGNVVGNEEVGFDNWPAFFNGAHGFRRWMLGHCNARRVKLFFEDGK